METRDLAAKKNELASLIAKKDQYLSEFRDKARALTAEIDAAIAEQLVKEQIESLSPAEKVALEKALKES